MSRLQYKVLFFAAFTLLGFIKTKRAIALVVIVPNFLLPFQAILRLP
jgi:hypothetical protein